jgi:16S rRNA (cytosine967-C5)-methyltransferase
MTTARELVTRRIARRAKQFPDLSLAPLDTTGLDPRDAALAGAIDHAIAARWITLTTVLAHQLDRPWEMVEPQLQAVLLAGAAQLVLLDRIPDHAAIHESVELARRLVRPGAAGLVNAVLRKVAGARVELVETTDRERRDEIPLADGRAWRLREDVFPADPVRRLAARTSHAETLVARWRAALGMRAAARLAEHGLVDPPIVIADLDGAAPGCVAHDEPGFHVYEGARSDLGALLERHAGARVQDPASARPVRATAGLSPRVIVDACAGRGTKTGQLARLHPDAQVVATDADPERLAALRAATADLANVEVVEPGELERWRGRTDLLVLDVPCTNTGVLARRVEAKYRFSAATLQSLRDRQRQIVADTLLLLADRGHLLYATCSLEAEENERQAEWLTRWHPMELVVDERYEPRGRPGDPATGYADGGAYTLLRRAGGGGPA